MGRLDGKIAVVTGGARGMGAATARLFVAEGARVIIADRLAEGKALADELGTDHAVFAQMDVTREEDWQSVVDLAARTFGEPNVLVNNAGIVLYGLIEEQDCLAFERALRVNVCGTLLGMKMLAPAMRRNDGGSIINVSSAVGLLANNGLGAYAASKWAVRGLSKVAALEMSPHGIRINTIHPGPINTPMGNPDSRADADMDAMHQALPLRRIGRSEEVANVSLFLASDESSFVTGADYAVDGGMSAGNYLAYLPGAL